MELPIVEQYDNIYVVRDDLIPGGTKSRYLNYLFDKYDEVVYASPIYGGAQLSLAYCSKFNNKKTTIFVPGREKMHPRTLESKKLGANVIEVFPKYFDNVQKKSKEYAEENNAYYLEFGGASENALDIIAEAARFVNDNYGPFDQVWSAAGSGILINGLQLGIKNSDFFGVQIGRDIEEPGKSTIIKHELKYDQECEYLSPFPSCPNYDRKAWEICRKEGKGKILFWNVMGD